MKKLFLFAWLLMLSIVATAQSIIVVDKDGNRIPYDPAKITSVDFQATPPGFTVNFDGQQHLYLFDQTVRSLKGTPYFLFANPDTVKVSGEGETFAIEVNHNVEYNITPSHRWLGLEGEDPEGQLNVRAYPNSNIEPRTGYFALASKDGQLTDTVFVVQGGKEDARYIDIDWTVNTLNSFNAETGETVITFKDEVPDMGKYDCFVLPEEQDYAIRVIESIEKIEDNTVTLITSEGDMGNLFKDTKITLGFGNKAEAAARAKGISSNNIIYPIKVQLYDGQKYVDVYNAQSPTKRAGDSDDEDDEGEEEEEEEAEENKTSAKTKIKMDCELEDFILLSDNYASANLDKFSYNVNLSGLMFLTFTKKEWYEFWKGELSDVLVDLHGHRDYNIEATHTVKSLGERRDEQVNEADYIEPALASKTMIFTFIKDGKVIRASVKLNLHACEFGYLAQGIGSAKTHISNSTDFTVADDNEIDYSNTNDDVYDTPLSMENATTEGLFAYSFNGDFSINMFGEDVFNAEYQIGNNVSFGRKTAQTPEMVNEAEGNSASIEVFKDFIAWDVTTNTDNMIGQRFADTYLIPYGLELNGAEKDIDVDINVKKSHKLTFHAYHQDHNGHRYDSKDAVVYVEIVSPSIIQNYYDVLDENGNLTMDFNYKSLDDGGTVTVTLCNLYYENLPNYTLPKRVWTFHPKGFDIECLSRGTTLAADQESVDMKFRLRKYEKGEWKNAVEKGVFFTVEPGEVSPTYERTNSEGIVTTTFTQDSPDFDFATLEATYRIKEPDDTYEGGTSELIFKEKKSDIKDVDLKKAKELDENTYKIDDVVTPLDGADDEITWFTLEDNEGNKHNKLVWFREHPIYYTVGWGGVSGWTEDMIDKEVDYLQELANGNKELYLSLGAFKDPAAGPVEGNMIDFNQDNLQKAMFKLHKNDDGSMSCIAFFQAKDGKTGMFNVKAKEPAQNAREITFTWSDTRKRAAANLGIR